MSYGMDIFLTFSPKKKKKNKNKKKFLSISISFCILKNMLESITFYIVTYVNHGFT